MKKIILASLITLFSTTSYSADVNVQQHKKTCEAVAELAKVQIQYRQSGGSILTATKANDETYEELGGEGWHDITQKIILDAFEQPKYSTEEYQQNAINEFVNKYYLGCMKMYE